MSVECQNNINITFDSKYYIFLFDTTFFPLDHFQQRKYFIIITGEIIIYC